MAAVGWAQEFQQVWKARKRDTDPGGSPQFSYTKERAPGDGVLLLHLGSAMGSGFIKICTYFPYPVKVWVNGHEWAKRQAAAAGIGFTALSNGFAACEDPAALRRSATGSAPAPSRCGSSGGWQGCRCPLTGADRDAGYWWELSMRQVETSRTLVFDDDVHARAFFEALVCENMDLGRPENVEMLFRRGQRRGGHSGPPPGAGSRPRSTGTATWSP